MIEVDKNYIEDISLNVNTEAFENTFNLVTERIHLAMNNLLLKNSYVVDYGLEIANEMLSGAETPFSSLDLFLIINAPQIEKNENEKYKNRFVNWLKNFAIEFKNNFKIFNRRIKSKKTMKKTENKIDKAKIYTMSHLYNDLQIQLSKVHYKPAKIQLFANKIYISNKNEYCCDVNIIPIFSSNNLIKIYNIANNKVEIVNYKNRYENLNRLNDVTDNMSLLQMRILNTLFYRIFNRNPNQVFIESLIFNVPIEIYSDDIYETTVNILNFIKNSAIQDFVSICDNKTNLFKDTMNNEGIDIAIKLLKSIRFVV